MIYYREKIALQPTNKPGLIGCKIKHMISIEITLLNNKINILLLKVQRTLSGFCPRYSRLPFDLRNVVAYYYVGYVMSQHISPQQVLNILGRISCKACASINMKTLLQRFVSIIALISSWCKEGFCFFFFNFLLSNFLLQSSLSLQFSFFLNICVTRSQCCRKQNKK